MRGFFKKNKKMIFDTNVCDTLNVNHFTRNAWMAIYPESSKEGWDNEEQNINLLNLLIHSQNALLNHFDFVGPRNFPKFRVVVLDEEYITWLKENSLTHSDNTCIQYMEKMITDEDAIRLLKKNQLDTICELYGIPVLCNAQKNGQTTEYKLTKELAKKLQDYLDSIYGSGNSFVSQYVLNLDEYKKNAGTFLKIAKTYFSGDTTNIQFGKWDTQKRPECKSNVYQLIIPYAIKRTFPSPIFDMDEVLESAAYAQDVTFSRDELDKYGLNGVKAFNGSDLKKAILTHLGDGVYDVSNDSICYEDLDFLMLVNN